jgi:hypothetical protein
VFQCGASGRSTLTSGRTGGPDGSPLESGWRWSPHVRTGPGKVRMRAVIIARTVSLYHPDARDQSAPFRGRERPDVINPPSGRGPHRGYKNPCSPHSSSYPTKSELLAACELFVFEFFGFLHFSHILGIVFQPLSLQFFFLKLLECYLFLEYEMHISAMLKFLRLSCDIIVYLFLLQVLFTAVILPNFCYPNKNIFWNTFLWKILVGSFAESCLPTVHPAGSVRGLWKIGLQFRPKLWTAPSLLSGTFFGLISWCHRWTTYLTSSRRTTGDISTVVLVRYTPD